VSEELRGSGLDAEAIAAVRLAQEQAANDRPSPVIEHAPIPDGDGAPDADPYLDAPRARHADDSLRSDVRFDRPQQSRGDHTRDDINDRFRAQRQADAIESAEELDEIEAIKRAQAEAAPPDMVPRAEKVRLTIRGKTIEVDPDQLLAMAQMNGSAQDYLREARATMDHAKAESARIIEQAQAQARNLTPLSQEDLEAVVNEAAYGDAEQATTMLANKLSAASQAAREKLEAERGQAALTEFLRENPQLANDEMAMAALETRLYSHFLDDLKRTNFPVDQLKDNNAIATIHMKMRADGKPVRGLKELFDAARDDYVGWRGGKRPAPPADDAPPPQPRMADPRITVNVNRDARRQNIPTQPPRSSSPMRNPEIMNTPDRTNIQARSDAAAKMIADRRAMRTGGRR
jgi:hypothetical protein